MTNTGAEAVKEALNTLETAVRFARMGIQPGDDESAQFLLALAEVRKLVEAQPAAGAGEAVLVPREPTQEMVDAGDNEVDWPVERLNAGAREIWHAMLAASPAAPAGLPTDLQIRRLWAQFGWSSECPYEFAHAVLAANSFHLPACDSSEASGSAIPARPTIPDAPIDMLLFCPACGLQHVDAPEASDVFRASMMQAAGVTENAPRAWTNPPHKSHLCHRCGDVWRPADVPTNGVLETKTRGANDSFTSMLGTPKTAASFDEFFDREYPNVEDRQGRFRNSNGYQLCWRGWEAATERAAAICRGVNNHDNPMTANDCADEIEKGLEP